MVLGMISAKKRIAKVNTIEKSGTRTAPNILWAYIPAIVAPAVLAIVLRMSIAAIGTEICFFIWIIIEASLLVFDFNLAASSVPKRVEYNVASYKEHWAEMNIVRNPTIISIDIQTSWLKETSKILILV
jgi:hypothetical protein